MTSASRSVLKDSIKSSRGYPVTSQSNPSETELHLASIHSPEWINFRYQNCKLPATEEPHDWCGNWVWEGCMNSLDHKNHPGQIYVKRFQRGCYRAECSKCVKKWINREAESIRNRIERGMKKTKRVPIHVLVSVPTWDYGLDIKKLRKRALVMSKQVGVEGGCMFFHPARFDKHDGKLLPYVSPHFHIIGFGWIKDTEILYKKEGYIIKNLGVRKTMGEVFGTVQYELTHVGIKKNVHSVTWFGSLSYSKLRVQKMNYKRTCPECKRELQRIDYTLTTWKLLDGQAPSEEYEGFVDPVGWERVATVYFIEEPDPFHKPDMPRPYEPEEQEVIA